MKPPTSRSPRRRTAADGFIIVAVLWMLSALSALVAVYATYVIDSAAGFAVHDDQLRADALVSGAIELTAYQYFIAPAPRPTHGQFSFRLGTANVDVEFRSETARIDLNAAPKPLLAGLFAVLGARRDDAEKFADRVIGWRTTPQNGADPEGFAYRAARLPYAPRGAKFPHVRELSLLLDLPTALVQRTEPFITVYSGRAQVNVFDAAPEVIAALPGMSRERVNALLAQRGTMSANGQALLAMLGTAQQFAITEGGRAIRVTVRIVFDNGRLERSEVVVLLFEEGSEPFSVLSWRNDLDGSRGDDGQLAKLQ